MPSTHEYYRLHAIEYNPNLIRQHPMHLVIELSIKVKQGAVVHAGLELQHWGSPHFHIITTVINTVLHYFVPQAQDRPNEDLLYFVTGKAVSITNHTPVGEGHSALDYDLEIDVLAMNAVTDCSVRVPPIMLVVGIAGCKLSDHEFYMDVSQYVAGKHSKWGKRNEGDDANKKPTPSTSAMMLEDINNTSQPPIDAVNHTTSTEQAAQQPP
ncbi:hypothetical protein L208DRAFT_1376651 [Tricholoma matsutake]|nr:hypothetical protein L208DRAFT_1376651 [Tricholoma matsutake 945]